MKHQVQLIALVNSCLMSIFFFIKKEPHNEVLIIRVLTSHLHKSKIYTFLLWLPYMLSLLNHDHNMQKSSLEE